LDSLTIMGLTWLVGTPGTVVLAWWLWFRDRSSRELQKWRKTLFLFGLIATSLNVALFAGWAVWLHFHYNPEAWKVHNVCGNIATYLCLALQRFLPHSSAKGAHALRSVLVLSSDSCSGFL